MSSPGPGANGPEMPDGFETYFEPVDPSELRIEEVPTVEAAEPPRRGFGFWRAVLWCIFFLAMTQVLPALLMIGGLAVLRGAAIVEQAKQATGTARPGESEAARDERFVDEILKTPDVQHALQAATVVVTGVGALFSLFFLPRVVGRDWRRRVALRVPHVEHVVLTALLVFPLIVFNGAIESVLSKLAGEGASSGIKTVIEAMRSWPGIVLVLGIAVGPAISEELFCRGLLGYGLVNRFGLLGGVLLTSFLFGLLHMNPLQFTIGLLMGIPLHLIYVATRSILVPMALHFLNNLFVILAESRDMPLLIAKSLEQSFEARPALFLMSAAVMCFVIGLAFYQSRVRVWTPAGTEASPALYPHVELPPEGSANRALPGPLPAMTIGLLIAATGLFAAVWFGW